jgi:hypothetical protein
MTVEYLGAPESENLTALYDVSMEIFRTGDPTSETEFLNKLIAEVSGTIDTLTGRAFTRGRFEETFESTGGLLVRLTRRPLVIIESATYAGDAVDAADLATWVIDNAEKGVLRNPAGFVTGTWVITYVAGYYVPDNDASDADISADGITDDSYNHATIDIFPKYLQVGDWLNPSGFTNAANNDQSQVAEIPTDQKKVKTNNTGMVDQAAGGDVKTVRFRTLPYAVERAALELIKSRYFARDIDPRLKGITTGTHKFQFSLEDLNSLVNGLLYPFSEKGSPIHASVHEGKLYDPITARTIRG